MKQLTSVSLFVIIICFIACSNSQKTSVKKEAMNTVKSKVNNPDLTEIKAIIERLNADYMSVLTDEEMALSVFYDDKNQYIDKYKSVLNAMDYMSDGFKANLIKKLESTIAGEGEANLRKATDPLFETSMYAEKIVFTGSDIEDEMAAIGVELSYPLIEKKCCPSDLFFDKINGKWIITGHEISR